MKKRIFSTAVLVFVLIFTVCSSVGCADREVVGVSLSLSEPKIDYDAEGDTSSVSLTVTAEIEYMIYCVTEFTYRLYFYGAEDRLLSTREETCNTVLVSIDNPTVELELSVNVPDEVKRVDAEPINMSVEGAIPYNLFKNGVPVYTATYWNFIGWLWLFLVVVFAGFGIFNFIRLAVGVFNKDGLDAPLIIGAVIPMLITALMLVLVF